MSDERIIEYLRDRGRVGVPIDFVSSVMSAVEDARPTRSLFGLSLPVLAGVSVVAVAIVLAFVLGPGRSVGPAPSGSPTPTAVTSVGTFDELRTELDAAVQALRDAPGVRGQYSSSLRDVLGGASWFDWRSNGDQVVIQRIDIDATETGWWLDPAGSPPATGRRITTAISVGIGDRYLFASASPLGGTDGWQEMERGPVLSFATGILSGEIDPAQLLGSTAIDTPDISVGTFKRRLDADGRVIWTAETSWRGGTATQRWGIAPDGSLQSLTIDIVGAALDPDGDFSGNMTSASLVFEVLTDPGPIFVPDLADVPDPADFGLPDDFPLPPPVVDPSPTPEPVAAVQLAECADPTRTYIVRPPDGWWTNATYEHPQLGELAACRFFGPVPFDLASATPDEFIPEGVSLTIDYIDGGCIGYINPMLESREVEVDGWAGTAAEFAQGKLETNPPGSYQYVINLQPDVDCEVGSFIAARTTVDMAGDYEANKALLDQVMASMEITFTAP